MTHLFKQVLEMKIQVKVFWVVMPRSFAVGYQHFRGPCCFNSLWRWRQHGPL